HCAGRQRDGELRLRRDAGAPRHRSHHRTRRGGSIGRRIARLVSRSRAARTKLMRNLWSDRDAAAAVKLYAKQGANEDLALRTYTTRLLGGEPRLVQHGGGNTSVKTAVRDSAGDMVEVLCVKGSGWDMGTIEPPGLPAVRLAPLLKLAALTSL